MSRLSCSAELYKLIEDEAEAITGYYNFLENFSRDLADYEQDIIYDIIQEEKDHLEKLRNIQER